MAPSGGPKDETPPQIVESESTPNRQTNFKERTFTLTFDEWVKLKSINQQLIVSPPLRYNPEIKQRGKEVTVTFDDRDTLRENTTYTIQFGEGIVDLNEDNPAKELRFVFSTGPKIDSLTASGKVLDVLTGEGVADVRVLLFDQLTDSIPLLIRPVYVSRTNETGSFRFENLRSDTFRLMAIKDENNDYLFSPGKEAVAFSDTLIITKGNIDGLSLTIFNEVVTPILVEKDLQPDRLRLQYDRKIKTDAVDILDVDYTVREFLGDSIIFWLPTRYDSLQIIENFGGIYDTSWIFRPRKLRRDTQNVKLMSGAIRKVVTSLNDSLILPFNLSISEVNSEFISLKDTTGDVSGNYRPNDQRQLVITANWKNGMTYKLDFLPTALTSINGKQNKDTISYAFSVPDIEKLGTIIFEVDSSFSGPNRLIQLYKSESLIRSFSFVSGETLQNVTLRHMQPGKYEIVIIEDENENGEWDTGDYLKGKQPERRVRRAMEPLRENWDLTVKLDL